MSISRQTFDVTKNYKRIQFHQDRDLLDSELNEQQDILNLERRKIADLLLKEGSILSGLTVTAVANVLTVTAGVVYIEGSIEPVGGATLGYGPATSGADYVFVELLKYNYGYTQDPTLVNPATGEPTAEREKWVVSLKAVDTSTQTLPPNVLKRTVVPIYKFDRTTGDIAPTVQEKSNLYLRDLLGTLPGSRITVSSITEDQLSFAAAEGLNSLLQNMAERTFDQAGSYLVKGFDCIVGEAGATSVEVITNAGRAYIQGFRHQRDLPTTTLVPISRATKAVRGEQKTFDINKRRYSINSTPLKWTTQVEAIVQILRNVTRGSVGGGEDVLDPNPVVSILEVSQGGYVYQEGVDWQQSGNMVDWTGSGNQPEIGTTYSVKWTYTKQLARGVDYVDGGWFGQPDFPAAGVLYYLVVAFNGGGESGFRSLSVVGSYTAPGAMNRISWLPVSGASGYRVYRSSVSWDRTAYMLLSELGSEALSYIDDGVDEVSTTNPEQVNSAGLDMSPVQLERASTNVINFGKATLGEKPLDGSNCSIDYEYFLGRRDMIISTSSEIKRLEGAPSDSPKLPVVPENTLGLCSIDCPANSPDMQVQNFGLKRITMDQIHDIIEDVESLKYNDAQYQMNSRLQNRDAQTKKGIYSDDFSSVAQSDIYHPDWDARINEMTRFVAPDRVVVSQVLTIDPVKSSLSLFASLALLPGDEVVLVEQSDWSEERNINPYAVFEKPPAMLQVTPNLGRRGQTGVAVMGVNFTPSRSGIILRCDGLIMASNLISDEVGRVNASFTISEFARNGSRIVELTDGVYSARASLRINDPQVITRIERIIETRIIRIPVVEIIWRTQTIFAPQDPLAQTFSFPQNQVVSSVGLRFTARDPSIPVTVQIRGVTTGIPNGVVLAEKVLAPSEIILQGETRVRFDDPFYAEANTSYAVVLLTNSSQYKVRTATLGKMGRWGVITRQTYTEGVLLESSNAQTWTPLNGSDLAINIYGYAFAPEGVIRFQPLVGVQFSDLNLDEYSAIPSSTNLDWEYSTDGAVTWDALVPAEEERLPNLATRVHIRARLRTANSNDTPAINIRDVNLVGYLNKTSGAYLTRENQLTQGIGSTKLYTQMDIPSGTTLQWLATNDGGLTWEPMTIEATRPVDATWTEYTLAQTFANSTGNRVRYKAVMTGTRLAYPRIHSLGATLS